MTTTPTPDAPTAEEPVATSCPRCGAVMRPDQDWCLMCGAAVTTEVSGARGWRTPIVIVGAVLTLAAIALVIAFVQLSDDANKTAAQQPAPTATPAAQTGQPTPEPTTAAPATSPTATPSAEGTPTASPSAQPGASPSATPAAPGTFADWPAGKSAYTVILWSATSRKEAERKATELQGAGAQNLGILHSDDYSSLRAGYHVVFSGQYGTNEEAQTAAQAAQGQSPGAYAKQVKPK